MWESEIMESSSSLKELTLKALEANKAHQYALTKYAEQLTEELQEVETLMDAINTDEDEEELGMEIQVPGAKKAMGVCAIAEFLDPASPFHEEASRRTRYFYEITEHSMKHKELETLAEAVRCENRRLQAYESQKRAQGFQAREIDIKNNTDGLDWDIIAEKVSSASRIKRTADQCRIKWLGDSHPIISNAWTAAEREELKKLVSNYQREPGDPVDWTHIAKQIGPHRTPIDCMRNGVVRTCHKWNQASDQKLCDAVRRYGTDNWAIVAMFVSEDATASQCSGRYFRALAPSLKRGTWSETEYARLKAAVEVYGNSWMEIAACIPGRTNEQCRERWLEHLSMQTSRESWTEEEDHTLLEYVSTNGKQWKAISEKLGNGRTGTQCRLRHDKLKRLQVLQAAAAAAGPSQPSGGIRVDGVTPHFKSKPRGRKKAGLQNPDEANTDVAVLAPKPRPKPRAVGKKGKEKATETQPGIANRTIETGPIESDIPSGSIALGTTSGQLAQGKRGSSNGLEGEAPPNKKKRLLDDLHNAPGPTSVEVVNPITSPAARQNRRTRTSPRKGFSALTVTEETPPQLPQPGLESSSLSVDNSSVERGLNNMDEDTTARPKATQNTRQSPLAEFEDPALNGGVATAPNTVGRPQKRTRRKAAPKRQQAPGSDVAVGPGPSPSANDGVSAADLARPKPRPKGRQKKVVPSNMTDTIPINQPQASSTSKTSTLKDGTHPTPQRRSARVAARGYPNIVEVVTTEDTETIHVRAHVA